MIKKTATQIAFDLLTMIDEPFGGKTEGRFKIARRSLRLLSGHTILSETLINEVRIELLDRNVLINDIGDDFLVLPIADNYRPVPKSVLAKYASGIFNEEEDK